jgi:hypothetical protein
VLSSNAHQVHSTVAPVSGQQYRGLGATKGRPFTTVITTAPGRLQVSFLCCNHWLKKWRGHQEMLHNTLSWAEHPITNLQLKGAGHIRCSPRFVTKASCWPHTHYWYNKRNGSTRPVPPFWTSGKALAKFGLHVGNMKSNTQNEKWIRIHEITS